MFLSAIKTLKNIPYQELMQNALFGVFREALTIVQDEGVPRVPGVVIDFDLTHLEVVLSKRLGEMFQGSMTIVLENWFEDLEVNPEGFWVTLNFNDTPERFYVPYQSILYFFDKNANIGFEIPNYHQSGGDKQERVTNPLPDENTNQTTNKVVSLDDFRPQ